MKLMCSHIAEDMPPQTQLYEDVKSFHSYIEAQNVFSVQMIQALLLIAFYEIGHGIYPAAYFRVGNVARLGYATGLHDPKAPQMLPRCNTSTEQEERRRLWWGITILDRFINIGHRGKRFATSDPALETRLPTEDEPWDEGKMVVAAPLSLSTSPTIRVSSYARTCQSAHLLGKILDHIDDTKLPLEYRFSDALQLHRTMRALVDAISKEVLGVNVDDPSLRPSLCVSMAIACSGLLTLYDLYSCTESQNVMLSEEHLTMQKESINGLSEISDRVVQLSPILRDIVQSGWASLLSPMVVDCVYQAAANCKL